MYKSYAFLNLFTVFDSRTTDGRLFHSLEPLTEKEFFLTLDVRDYSGSLNLSVKGKEAEYFLSCDIKQFAVDSTARKLVMTKLNNLIKTIADLGVVKEAVGDYTICSSIIKYFRHFI